jgi:hypothetical protein
MRQHSTGASVSGLPQRRTTRRRRGTEPRRRNSFFVYAISVSKRSCLNDLFKIQWMTSGSHGRPYPNWALLGDACLYQCGDQVDPKVEASLSATARRSEIPHSKSTQGFDDYVEEGLHL